MKPSTSVTGPAELVPVFTVQVTSLFAEPEDDVDLVIKDALGKKIIVSPKLSSRQKFLAKYLVKAGGDAKYLIDLANAKKLEKVIKASAADVRNAAGLAAAVRTGNLAEFMDTLLEDTGGDASDLKARLNGALSVLKKMLKFGVDVEVFSGARTAVQTYLVTKGFTFDDEEGDEDSEVAGDDDAASNDA